MTSKKIKVLLVVPDFFHAIGILAQYLAKTCADIDFYFFCESSIRNRKDDFLTLVRHIDAIHFLSNLSTLNLPSDMRLSSFTCPKIATVHHVVPGEEEKITKAALADVIHVIASEWVSFIQEQTPTPVHLAHQAIALDDFRENRQVNRPRDPFRIGSFGLSGSLNGRKRFDVLLEALSQLRRRNAPIEFVVRGSIWKDLADPFKEKQIPVRNLGYVSTDNLSQGYREIDLYVCTSDIEGGPLPVLEAMASGVPVVSTPVGVARDALPLGGGWLVEKNNPDAFAETIYGLILDRNRYDRLRNETQCVAGLFSGSNISKEYVSLYQRAIWQYQENNHCQWSDTPTISLSPRRQRERELAYSYFQEARNQKKLGYGVQGFANLIRSSRNIDVPLRDKIRGILNFLRN